MLKELLDGLVELAKKSDSTQILFESKNGEVMYRRASDGTIGTFEKPPDPRQHKALDLSAVTEFAADNDGSVIWYSREAVVCLIDDETRRDRVTLTLDFSPQIKLLRKMEAEGTTYMQAPLVLLLRTTLAECAADETTETLLPSVRSITFTKTAEGQSVIDHGKASVGKRLTEQATGAKAIPETVAFEVPIFAAAFYFTGTIKCAVDVDAGKETFRLIPFPLEIERAISDAELKIQSEILESDTKRPIHYGAP